MNHRLLFWIYNMQSLLLTDMAVVSKENHSPSKRILMRGCIKKSLYEVI